MICALYHSVKVLKTLRIDKTTEALLHLNTDITKTQFTFFSSLCLKNEAKKSNPNYQLPQVILIRKNISTRCRSIFIWPLEKLHAYKTTVGLSRHTGLVTTGQCYFIYVKSNASLFLPQTPADWTVDEPCLMLLFSSYDFE